MVEKIHRIERTSDLIETSKRWEICKLPSNMDGRSFLDIGCWAGGFCVEAKKRGATRVLGVDYVKSDYVTKFTEEYDFEFLQCDVFSEKFLEIPNFDVVFCSGVLYHVENPVSLLFRLKVKTMKFLLE